jgi:hypothetical protein
MALPALSPPFTSRYFPVSCAAGRYTSKLKLFGCLLDPSHEKQNDKDDQDDADESDATVTIPVPIAAEAATESTEQKIMRMITRMSPSDRRPFALARPER